MSLAFNSSWAGHEFLDAVREEKIWETVKAKGAEKGLTIPFDIVKSLAIEAVKSIFGL